MTNYPASFTPEIVDWVAPDPIPAQHTHITQVATLPEECPACSGMWSNVRNAARDINLDEEFRVARQFRKDWGDETMNEHLTTIRERALIAKARREGMIR